METLFFILSKIVQFCIEPLNWVIIFVILSLLFMGLRKPHLCKRFLLLALADLLIIGWLPTSEVFLRALEDAVPKVNIAQMSEKDFGGIIILGGAIEGGEIAVDRGEVSIYSAAERVTKAFELIRRYPDLPFIFSGFSGRLSPKGMSEADAFKQLVVEQGLPDKNAHYENQSRNTYENIVLMKPMMLALGAKGANQVDEVDKPEKPWLLITSASHMYRSLKIFQKQGIEVIPVPVDYQTGNQLRWDKFDLEDGVQNWNKVMHEGVGLLAYWITGKI
ncbi:MAG: YdcF family protein [Polynucleobacter sp.]